MTFVAYMPKNYLCNVFIFEYLCIFSVIWLQEYFLIFILFILNGKNLAILQKGNSKHEMSVYTYPNIFTCTAHVYILLCLHNYIVNTLINCD